MRAPRIRLIGVAIGSLLALAGCRPSAPDALKRGDTLCQAGRLDGAIYFYSEAIRLDPHSASAYQKRGEAYLKQEAYQEAIADLTETIRLDPAAISAYRQRGFAYLRLADYREAIADLDVAIDRDGEAVDAYLGRAEAYLGQGRFDEAIADADRAVAMRPVDTRPLLLRGRAYFGNADLERAEADFGAAIRIDRGCAYAYWNRAQVRQRSGRAEEAAQDQRRAEQLDPGFELPETSIGKDVLAGLRGRQDGLLGGPSLDPDLGNKEESAPVQTP